MPPKDYPPPKLTKITFRPGINRELTSYAGEGGWYDCDKIRFRNGLPETIGGWSKINSADQFLGKSRKLHSWIANDGADYMGNGTHKKLYIEWAGDHNDITPLRTTVTLGANPFTTTISSAVVTVSHTSHGAANGDYVTFSGAAAVGGITISGEYEITYVNANSYTITHSSSATSSATGGGASVSAAYQISIGSESAQFGSGWGAGTWGSGVWGGTSTSAVLSAQARIWSMDNFGEDLFACIRDGALYYWDKTGGLSARAVALDTLTGASDTPTIASAVMVSSADRHAIAFGANTIGTSTQDKVLIRWSDAEDISNWTPSTTSEAGSLRLSSGSQIVSAVKARGEIVVLTDRSLHSMRFVPAPFIFGESLVSDSISIIGPNAAFATDDAVLWMGNYNFYAYSGRVIPLPCTVEDYVFQDINRNQRFKIFGAYNAVQREAIWLYPSASSNECDRYVAFNLVEKVWYYGTFTRTAWHSATTRIYPVAAGTDGYLYYHEYGTTADGSALQAYIESAMFDIEDGDRAMFVKRAIPDVTFNGSSAASPAIIYTFKTRMFPGAGNLETETGTVTRTASTPIEQYTNQLHIRKRGRQMLIRIENTASGVRWRAGAIRLDMRPDGKR